MILFLLHTADVFRKEAPVRYRIVHHDKQTSLHAGDRLLINADTGHAKLTRGIVHLRFLDEDTGSLDNQMDLGTNLSSQTVTSFLAMMCALTGLCAELVEGGGRIYVFEFQNVTKES